MGCRKGGREERQFFSNPQIYKSHEGSAVATGALQIYKKSVKELNILYMTYIRDMVIQIPYSGKSTSL